MFKLLSKSSFFSPVLKFAVALLIISMSAACVSTTSPKVSDKITTNIPADELVPDSRFYINAGDQLAIKFYYNPELTEEQVVVLPDGSISLQLIGTVQAKGRTVDELATELKQRYSGIITRAEITVLVKSLRERSVFVGGEVQQPGEYINKNGLNPLQAVFLAGGFKSSAELGSILILRRVPDSNIGYYIYDLKESFSELALFDDFKLKDSDIVFVSKNSIGSFAEFVDSYLSGILPDWINVLFNYEINRPNVN